MEKDLYKIKELCDILDVSESYIRKKIKAGKIKTIRFAGIKIHKNEIERLKKNGVE